MVEHPDETAYYTDRPELLTPARAADESGDGARDRLILPRAAGLSAPAYRPGVTARVLLTTSERSVLHMDPGQSAYEPAAGDKTGPQKLAILAETDADAQILLLGSADMLLARGDVLDASGNLAFLSGCVLRMTHQDVLYSLDAGVKRLPARLIQFPSEETRRRVSAVLLLALPLLLLAVMTAVTLYRRRL